MNNPQAASTVNANSAAKLTPVSCCEDGWSRAPRLSRRPRAIRFCAVVTGSGPSPPNPSMPRVVRRSRAGARGRASRAAACGRRGTARRRAGVPTHQEIPPPSIYGPMPRTPGSTPDRNRFSSRSPEPVCIKARAQFLTPARQHHPQVIRARQVQDIDEFLCIVAVYVAQNDQGAQFLGQLRYT